MTTEAQQLPPTITPSTVFHIRNDTGHSQFAALAHEHGSLNGLTGYRAVGMYGTVIVGSLRIRDVFIPDQSISFIEFCEQPDDAVPTEEATSDATS